MAVLKGLARHLAELLMIHRGNYFLALEHMVTLVTSTLRRLHKGHCDCFFGLLKVSQRRSRARHSDTRAVAMDSL